VALCAENVDHVHARDAVPDATPPDTLTAVTLPADGAVARNCGIVGSITSITVSPAIPSAT
jgi:hypothetical protein